MHWRRMYRHIPSQKWESESILNTLWWDKNMKKFNHSECSENIDFAY